MYEDRPKTSGRDHQQLAQTAGRFCRRSPRDGLTGAPPGAGIRPTRQGAIGAPIPPASAQRRRNGSSVTCRGRIRGHDPLVTSVTRSSSLASRAAAASSRGGFSIANMRISIGSDNLDAHFRDVLCTANQEEKVQCSMVFIATSSKRSPICGQAAGAARDNETQPYKIGGSSW